MITTTTIEYVYVEDHPHTRLTFEVDTLEVAYSTLPPAFLDALDELYRHVDTSQCAHCDDPVGYVLRAGAGAGEVGPEGVVQWKPTGLAREGDGPVVALCQDCTPSPLEVRTVRDCAAWAWRERTPGSDRLGELNDEFVYDYRDQLDDAAVDMLATLLPQVWASRGVKMIEVDLDGLGDAGDCDATDAEYFAAWTKAVGLVDPHALVAADPGLSEAARRYRDVEVEVDR